MGSPLRVDTRFSQPRPRGLAADARDPAHRSAQLLAPELKHRLDEPKECVHVRDIHGRFVTHFKHDKG